jgi:hypothetical protein
MQDMLATVVLTTEDTYVGAMELAALRIVKVLSTVLCCSIFRSALYCPKLRFLQSQLTFFIKVH